jgi:hypothetical protein
VTSSPAGYQPVDLSGLRNRDVTIFDDPPNVTLGPKQLYGLPFDFGTAERAVLMVGPDDAVTIPLRGCSRWVIIAHAIYETDLFDGTPVGAPCGQYTWCYADGSEATHLVRQRFEIGPSPRLWEGRPLPLDWGQTPFLAHNGAEHQLMDRICGRFDEAGARLVDIEDAQSRVPYVLPYRYYLWAYENPYPDRGHTGLRIAALHSSLLIGAVTASDLTEEPFTRDVSREVLITVADADLDEHVRLSVDRGTATYVYRRVPQGDIDTALPAWGHPSAATRHGYARVSASPSATLVLLRGDAELGRCRWQDVVGGNIHTMPGGATLTLAPAAKAWVRITIRDADTGETLPARLHCHTADGIPVAPYGHHAHINSDGGTWNLDIGGDVRLGSYTYAFIDGACEGWLPIGEVAVEVSHGFHYRPLVAKMHIEPGQQQLDLTLHRVFDPRDDGYYSGDTHVHFVSTHGAEMEARAEDVDVVNLLLSQWGHLYTGTEEFTGRPEVSRDGHTVVFAGQENRTNMLGHINLLGLRAPIMPWCTGGSEEADFGGGLETTLSHWADECHAQGGTVVLAHFPVPNGEAAALIATGRLDAVETIAYDDYNIGEYYRYLNAGYRLPLVAGTDKMTSEVPIGLMRTYARIADDQTFDYWSWCDAVRSGDTVASSGPFLTLRVGGARPGEEVAVDAATPVPVQVAMSSIFPVGVLEIVVNGEVVHRVESDAGVYGLDEDIRIEVPEDSWVVARCFGVGSDVLRHNDTWQRPVVAHTSPVYLRTAERYRRYDHDTVATMLALVDGAAEYIEQRARRFWPDTVCHRHGRDDHLAFLLGPLDEARHLLRQRIDHQR